MLDVLASGSRDAGEWLALGPPFFVAGLAGIPLPASRLVPRLREPRLAA